MSTAPTPGPWYLDTRQEEEGFLQIRTSHADYQGGRAMNWIADIAYENGYRADEENLANARLVAASPSLLAALKAVLIAAELDDWGSKLLLGQVREAITQADPDWFGQP